MSLLRQAPVPGTRSAALQRIRAVLDSLAPSERRVGEAILEEPGAAIALSISEFAERCGVAQPTLSRFAKNVGFAGYPALRLGIAHDFAAHDEPASDSSAVSGPETDVVRALRTDAAMGPLAEAIRFAPAVEIWSAPDMAAGAELLAAQLRSLAVPAAASALPSHWALRAEGLPVGATVLVLSNSSADLLAGPAVRQARSAGSVIAAAAVRSARSREDSDDLVLTLSDLAPPEMLSLFVAEAVSQAVRDVSNLAGPPGPASPWLLWPHRTPLLLPTDREPLPAVLLRPAEISPTASLVVYLPGLNGSMRAASSPASKENGIDAAIVSALINAGHQVLVTENPAHGDRKRVWESTEALLHNSLSGIGPDLLAESRTEAAALVDAVLAAGLIDDTGRLAIVGQSWGGLQALLKMSGDARIACGVGIMPICDPTVLLPFQDCAGSERVEANSLRSPLADGLAPRPILLISGEDDAIATVAQVTELEDRLRPGYAAAGHPDRLEHIKLPGVGHHFNAAQIDYLLAWLDKSDIRASA